MACFAYYDANQKEFPPRFIEIASDDMTWRFARLHLVRDITPEIDMKTVDLPHKLGDDSELEEALMKERSKSFKTLRRITSRIKEVFKSKMMRNKIKRTKLQEEAEEEN